MTAEHRLEAFGATTEHAVVELACLRAQRLQRMMAEVEQQLRSKVNEWVAVDLSSAPEGGVAEAWASQRGIGWLEDATKPEVAFMNRLWDALFAFRSPHVVARLQLLDALADAAVILEAQPPGPHAEELRRRILAHAARMFELSNPEAAGRLSLEQWDAALVAWQRKGGRPPAGERFEPKWEAMAAFVVEAGLSAITAEGLMKNWQEWNRGMVTSSLVFGAEATDNSEHDAGSQAPGIVGSGPRI
jgi:hypothetical protein